MRVLVAVGWVSGVVSFGFVSSVVVFGLCGLCWCLIWFVVVAVCYVRF